MVQHFLTPISANGSASIFKTVPSCHAERYEE